MPLSAERNYFELFGFAAAYELDSADLAARYRDIARELHPDRHVNGSDHQRRLAAQMSATLNEAYQTLKDPLSRASYLLKLRGFESTTASMTDNAFLVGQMELRERLDDAGDDLVRISALATDVEQGIAERQEQLRTQLAPATWAPQAALRTIHEMQFLNKLRRQIGDQEEKLA